MECSTTMECTSREFQLYIIDMVVSTVIIVAGVKYMLSG